MDVPEAGDQARRSSQEQIGDASLRRSRPVRMHASGTRHREVIIGELSKAWFVKNLTEKGLDRAHALRERAQRIRLVQRGFEEQKQSGG